MSILIANSSVPKPTLEISILFSRAREGESSSEYQESELDTSLNCSTDTSKTIRIRNRCAAWSIRETIRTDIFNVGVPREDNARLLTEFIRDHFRTTQPNVVLSITVFCDSSLFVPMESNSMISIPINGYVQTKQNPVSTMTAWIGSADWRAVPGGLSTDYEFQRDLRRADNPSDPRIKLAIFSKLDFNNHGRAEARQARKVSRLPRSPPYPSHQIYLP